MKDEWLRAAMSDDKMVAELLLRLKESDPHPSAFARQAGAAVAALLASLPPFDWGMRLPRSKSAAAASASAGKKDRERTRRSPTTPLSWSACGVGSGGAGCGASPSDGYEDSSRPSDRLFSAVRSKVTAAHEISTSTPGTKRPRRKKTFAELKDEESSLMKDRTHLKRELDTLRIKLEEERALNEKLKRIKLDVSQVPPVNKSEQGEEEKNEREMEASTTTSNTGPWNTPLKVKQAKPEHVADSDNLYPAQNQCKKDGWMEKASFVLPDLNMMPEEDQFSWENTIKELAKAKCTA